MVGRACSACNELYLVESRRVLFVIPIVLKTVQAIEALARNDALPLITSTLASCDIPTNRGIIQNEALIALNIILMLANGRPCRVRHERWHVVYDSFSIHL